jgi:hypothetical protein
MASHITRSYPQCGYPPFWEYKRNADRFQLAEKNALWIISPFVRASGLLVLKISVISPSPHSLALHRSCLELPSLAFQELRFDTGLKTFSAYC